MNIITLNSFSHLLRSGVQFWPSLLNIKGFLLQFITPIVKITKGKRSKTFFTVPEFEEWKEGHDGGKGWTSKVSERSVPQQNTAQRN